MELKTENRKVEKTYLDLPGRAAHGAVQHHSPALAQAAAQHQPTVPIHWEGIVFLLRMVDTA